MNKKFGKQRIGFGKNKGSRKGKIWSHWFTAEKSSTEENSDNSASNSAPSSEDADLRPKKRRS
ncbi:hypothetical protein [Pseudomonas sp.]|uniref:hypothetical protein n=1 Tax=Pseudomonas sp. TaxID=306 RepID=UPI003267CDDE